MTSQTGQQMIKTYLPNISTSQGDQTLELD